VLAAASRRCFSEEREGGFFSYARHIFREPIRHGRRGIGGFSDDEPLSDDERLSDIAFNRLTRR